MKKHKPGATKTVAEVEAGLKRQRGRELIARESAGALAGGIAGAVIGMGAGPAGAIAGGLIGAATGATVEDKLERWEARGRRHDAELDAAIGVSGGELGAPNLEHPPARFGAFSGASSGLSTTSAAPPEGPMSTPPED